MCLLAKTKSPVHLAAIYLSSLVKGPKTSFQKNMHFATFSFILLQLLDGGRCLESSFIPSSWNGVNPKSLLLLSSRGLKIQAKHTFQNGVISEYFLLHKKLAVTTKKRNGLCSVTWNFLSFHFLITSSKAPSLAICWNNTNFYVLAFTGNTKLRASCRSQKYLPADKAVHQTCYSRVFKNSIRGYTWVKRFFFEAVK